MNKVLRAIVIVLCFEMGAILLYLPWSAFWERNYFLSHFPALMTVFLHPSFRGMVSGLGVLDIFVAASFLQSTARPQPTAGPSSVHPRRFAQTGFLLRHRSPELACRGRQACC